MAPEASDAAWRVILPAPTDTHRLGVALGRSVLGPLHVALVGELGAGKTLLAQGVGAGLGVVEPVTSPTFLLLAEYDGRLPLLHADLYRLEPGAGDEPGLEEQAAAWPGVVLVEWPDRCPELLHEDHIVVQLIQEAQGRTAELRASGPGAAVALSRWRAAWEAP